MITVDEPDALVHADAANQFEADVYLGFEASADGDRTVVSFYAVPSFESAGGRSLAERIASGLHQLPDFDVTSAACACRCSARRGCRRCSLSVSEVRRTVDLSVDVTAIVRDALEQWTGRSPGERLLARIDLSLTV